MAAVLRNFAKNFHGPIEQPLRQHLKNVYACLTLSGISAAVGSYLHVYTAFSLGSTISSLLVIGLVLALYSTPPNGKNMLLRIGFLLGLSFCTGMSMGPLISHAITINPSLILTALTGTSLIFACFTLSVLHARRGYWLFLIGPLSSLGSALLLLSLANIFFGSHLMYQINLYGGLLLMSGFVVFDTTLIIEKFRMGDKDFVGHSLDLFIDFIGMFKRILIILTEKERESQERKRN